MPSSLFVKHSQKRWRSTILESRGIYCQFCPSKEFFENLHTGTIFIYCFTTTKSYQKLTGITGRTEISIKNGFATVRDFTILFCGISIHCDILSRMFNGATAFNSDISMFISYLDLPIYEVAGIFRDVLFNMLICILKKF